MIKFLNYLFKRNVFFKGRLITLFRYHNILTGAYRDMLKSINDGEEYPTWV